MKNLTRTLLIVALFSFSASVFAQTIGIKAGLNLANTSMKFGGEDVEDLKMRTAWHLGAVVAFPLSDLITLEPGLLISSKGTKIDEEGFKMTASPLYVDIPINFKFGGDVGGAKIYGLAGPYIGIGVAGKSKTEIEGQDDVEESIEWGSDEEKSDMKRLDYGLGFGAGAEFGAIGVEVSYQLGLANLVPGGDGDNSMKNRNIMISVAYYLGR